MGSRSRRICMRLQPHASHRAMREPASRRVRSSSTSIGYHARATRSCASCSARARASRAGSRVQTRSTAASLPTRVLAVQQSPFGTTAANGYRPVAMACAPVSTASMMHAHPTAAMRRARVSTCARCGCRRRHSCSTKGTYLSSCRRAAGQSRTCGCSSCCASPPSARSRPTRSGFKSASAPSPSRGARCTRRSASHSDAPCSATANSQSTPSRLLCRSCARTRGRTSPRPPPTPCSFWAATLPPSSRKCTRRISVVTGGTRRRRGSRPPRSRARRSRTASRGSASPRRCRSRSRSSRQSCRNSLAT
mmetsp:Transcript_42369/g.88544  ORF Transcript_42369/g.88544 Transcript_42369/m.88544 type:complete len:307 (+) Transcript_42369:510-1430(+)